MNESTDHVGGAAGLRPSQTILNRTFWISGRQKNSTTKMVETTQIFKNLNTSRFY
jgi:hypothetical protein